MVQVSTIHFHASQQERFNYRKKITKKGGKKKKTRLAETSLGKGSSEGSGAPALPTPALSPWWLQLPFVALTRRVVCSAAAEVQRRFLPTLLTTHNNFFLHRFLFQKRRVKPRSAVVTDGRLENPSRRGAGWFSHKTSLHRNHRSLLRGGSQPGGARGDNAGATGHCNGQILFDNAARFHSIFFPFLKHQNKPHLNLVKSTSVRQQSAPGEAQAAWDERTARWVRTG